MEHKLEKNGKFGVYREMNELPDELVILDSQSRVSKDNNSERNKDFIKVVEIENEDKFFTLPRVEKVTPVTPVEPVEKVTPVTPVGSDDNYEGYHTVFSFQKDIRTGGKTFVKTTLRGRNNESERLVIEGGDFSQHDSMEIDEDEAKQEQLPPHNFNQKK